MKAFEKSVQNYQNTPVPRELSDRVRQGIAEGKRRARRQTFRRTAGTVAACLALTFAGLNISPTFAAAAGDLPVVGPLFQLMTVRSTQTSDEDGTVTVQQPGITGGGALADRVNQEIQEKVNEKTAEGQQLIQEYKDAFFATGGTQEEWDQHDNQVTVTYDIKSQTDTTVSFVLESAVSIANAYQEETYYNLDIASGEELTLANVLGEDWVRICNDSIQRQMAERPEDYFTVDEGGFTSVDETTSFYLNAEGDAVVVFPPYSVAPGYLGSVEFVIQ